MMKNLRPEKENIIKEKRNPFYTKKRTKLYCSYFGLLSQSNFWRKNYIEYDIKGDRNKTISNEEYLYLFRPYLKDIIDNLKKSDT